MNQNKLSQYFFIVAAVVAILDSAFQLDAAMQSVKFILLVFSGIVVGALRHHDQKEFLLSGVAVIITGFILTEVLAGTLANFSVMIYNFIIFLSAAIVVVGIEQIANIITFEHKEESSEEQVKKFKNMSSHEIKHATFEHIWGVIILIAVALTFIVLLAQSFFDVSRIADELFMVEAFITILFIVDLVILYEKAGSFSKFLHKNIFDIIAAIPSFGMLRGLKLIRAVRIIRVMNKSTQVTKIAKMYKTSKFFSEESAFNKLENKEARKRLPKKQKQKRKKPSVRNKPIVKTKVKTVSVNKRAPVKKKSLKKTASKKKTPAKRKPVKNKR
ncbi:hypothetical protein K9M74_01970 [Candidatus Woesearchaeota archaeon]|nr:hypothetical protein [Candidatus Woesearchaeota archaeon]